MSDEQEMVTAFHRAFDIAIGTLPAVPDAATCALRVSLIQEKFAELCEALSQQDIEAIAKELADFLYVVYGVTTNFGLLPQALWRRASGSVPQERGRICAQKLRHNCVLGS